MINLKLKTETSESAQKKKSAECFKNKKVHFITWVVRFLLYTIIYSSSVQLKVKSKIKNIFSLIAESSGRVELELYLHTTKAHWLVVYGSTVHTCIVFALGIWHCTCSLALGHSLQKLTPKHKYIWTHPEKWGRHDNWSIREWRPVYSVNKNLRIRPVDNSENGLFQPSSIGWSLIQQFLPQCTCSQRKRCRSQLVPNPV